MYRTKRNEKEKSVQDWSGDPGSSVVANAVILVCPLSGRMMSGDPDIGGDLWVDNQGNITR